MSNNPIMWTKKYAGKAGSLEDFLVRHVVLPFDVKDGAQAALVKPLQ